MKIEAMSPIHRRREGAAKGEAQPPAVAVERLMDGYLTAQLLFIAAKLGVADALAGGPQTSDWLARRVGADPDALRRVLRGLASECLLDELPDGRFGLNARGARLRSDVPGSLRASIIARGDLYYGAAADLLEAVRHGEVAFERVYGSSFFDYLHQHPESSALFQASMEDRARREAADVVASYDFGAFERLADVGGGHGVLLAAILATVHHLGGTLFDLPPVVERAREKLKKTGLSDRCEFIAGNFFKAVPPGACAYVLSRIIHDWDDEAAVTILRNCRRAMESGGTLLLVEMVLPDLAKEAPAAIRMDLHMLTLLRGRERTTAEYERLLAKADFRLRRIVSTRAATGVSVIEAE